MVDNLSVAEVLEKARDLMNDEGKHWVRGFLRLKDRKTGEVSYCSRGAILAAAPGDENKEIRAQAIRLLAEEVNPEGLRYFYPRYVVEEWNDYPLRNWNDVSSAFKRTVARLRGED